MTKMIDKTELFEDRILGSGALGFYSWWIDAEMTDDGVTLYSDEGVHTVTATQARSAFVKLVMEKYPAFQGVNLTDPDIDAELADCILQQAAFGEVLFG